MKRNELPTEKSLKKLPRWGRVAVIARALRRAMPLIAAMLDRGSAKILESIEFALIQAELSAAEGGSSEHLLWSCNQLAELARTVAHSIDDCDEDYTHSAILAAYLVTTCCITADEEIEIEALEAISNVVFHFERFKRRKALRKAADKMVIADFDRLRSAFIKAELQIDSAVPVAVLGELWPKSMPAGWPSDSKFKSAHATFKRPRSNRQALSLLPDDLLKFLEGKPSHVIDSPSFECGRLILNKLEYLAITEHLFSMKMTDWVDSDPNRDASGSYVLKCIELVCYCEHYRPAGKLCWFVEYECLGCYDADFGTVYLFQGVSWKRFLARTDFYLNSPWNEPHRPIVLLKNPWDRLTFRKSKSVVKTRNIRSDDEIIDELLNRRQLGTLEAGTARDTEFDTICERKPLDRTTLSQFEKSLGHRLPPLLRRMYCEVANGGFGESYGLIGLVGGARDDTNRDVQQLLHDIRKADSDDPKWSWPDKLLPAFYVGCAMYLCIDCYSKNGRVVLFEPNNHVDGRSWKNSFIPFSPSLRKMMDDWLSGLDLWAIAGICV